MWIVAKYEKKKINFFIENLKKKLDGDLLIYNPSIKVKIYYQNKLIDKKINILGDYIFCFSSKFSDKDFFHQLRFIKGLKYFLDGFANSQNEIKKFINKCKNFENKDGSISSNFFELKINEKYRFNSGPLLNLIFQLIDVQKKKLKILIGNKTTTVSKDILVCPL